MAYRGRPGVSPVLATLIALDEVRPTDRILDVGCGNGDEALLLAAWGCKRVDAIDPDPDAIRIARGRATRRKLADRVRFERLDAADLPRHHRPGTFRVVLHTLVANNLHDDEAEPHFAAVRTVMKKNGLLVVQERIHHRYENEPPDAFGPLAGLAEHFELSTGVTTHLPERRAARRDPDYARIVLWLGRPRR